MGSLDSKRVMIVEDNRLVADLFGDLVASYGALPVGPFATVAAALAGLEDEAARPDAAILDVNLDRLSFDVADRLRALDIPFLFVTGQDADLPCRYRDVVRRAKPVAASSLVAGIETALEGACLS